MLVISGYAGTTQFTCFRVSISQSRCLSFQGKPAKVQKREPNSVSISQSRCLSFQVGNGLLNVVIQESFNLAIEMLVISGPVSILSGYRCCLRFNLAIEMLVISGRMVGLPVWMTARFNLAIEMLVISGEPRRIAFGKSCGVSISQSRCLSFQVGDPYGEAHPRSVSISQSRCLSFQGNLRILLASPLIRFNLAIEMLVISGRRNPLRHLGCPEVSISQSRCLSFQALAGAFCPALSGFRFNLAIEMLVISGFVTALTTSSPSVAFQSRNRDACHFRSAEMGA